VIIEEEGQQFLWAKAAKLL